MPLQDHFHPPLYPRHHWESFHSQWASKIVDRLNSQVLSETYTAAPLVDLHGTIEVDVGAFEESEQTAPNGSGIALATYSPPKPRLRVPVEFTGLDTFEVRVLEEGTARLVAAIELVSPANKDREANRRAFAMKCAGYLHHGVSVVIVDLVTNRRGNFLAEILKLFDRAPDPKGLPDSLYAGAWRTSRDESGEVVLEGWPESLALGRPLPTIPLWLAPGLAVPLELEPTYLDACTSLRLPV